MNREHADTIAFAINDAAEVLARNLVSPNCADSNLEPANVVDGLYRIAGSLQQVASALEKISLSVRGHE